MSESSDDEVKELRRKVAELMGRCVLKLQRYELAMKQFLATSEFKIQGNG